MTSPKPASSPLPDDLELLRDVSTRLERHDLLCLVTGAIAYQHHASLPQPSALGDIDLIASPALRDANAIFREFGRDFFFSPELALRAILNEGMFELIQNNTTFRIQIEKPGLYQQARCRRRLRIAIRDFSVFIIGKEDLIISKLRAAADLPTASQMRDLRRLLDGQCDRGYLEQWTREFGVHSLWREIERNAVNGP